MIIMNNKIKFLDEYGRNSVEKMKICIQCDKFKKSTKQCSVCGCFMPVKVIMPGMHCPEKKW